MPIQLVNSSTGQPDDVGVDNVVQALAAGTHVPSNGARALVTPTGDLHIIPQDQLHAAQQAGYRVPTAAELNNFAGIEKYGTGAGNMLKAGVEGMLRGAAAGLSDVAEVGSGISSKEAVEGRKKYNPWISGVTEFGGAVAGAIAAPEISPAGWLSKIGAGVTEAVLPEGANALGRIASHVAGAGVEGAAWGAAQTMDEAVLGNPQEAAQRLVGNIGLGALLGGSFGGVISAGQEAIPASIDAAKSVIGKGWRTMFGDAVPHDPGAPPEAFSKDIIPGEQATGAPDLSSPGEPPPPALKDGWAPRTIAKIKEMAGGPPAGETLESFRNRGGGGKGELMSPDQFNTFERGFISDLKDGYEAMEQATKDVNIARPQEKMEMLKDMNPAQSATELSKMSQAIDGTLAQMKADITSYTPSMVNALGKVKTSLETALAKPEATAGEHYLALDNAKKSLKELTDHDANHAEKLTSDMIREPYNTVQQSLTDSSVWGDAAARQSQYNDAISAHIDNTKILRQKFFTKVPGTKRYEVAQSKVRTFLNNIKTAKADAPAQALRNYYSGADKVLSQIEETYKSAPFENFDKEALTSTLNKTLTNADRAYNIGQQQPAGMGHGGLQNITTLLAGGYFGGPIGAAAAMAKIMGEAASNPAKLANLEKAASATTALIGRGMKAIFQPASNTLRAGMGPLIQKMLPPADEKSFQKKADSIRKHLQSPGTLVDTLHDATKDGQDAAPKTMAAVQQTALQALSFLQSKLPPEEPETPFEVKEPPTEQAMRTFNLYYDAVHNPLHILDELKSGMLSPERLEVSRAVYPSLHNDIAQAALMHAVGRKGEAVPYQTKVMLSLFMGQPLDKSMQPANIQAMQAVGNMAAAQQQAQQGPHPTAGGLGKLSIASREGTTFQQAANREKT